MSDAKPRKRGPARPRPLPPLGSSKASIGRAVEAMWAALTRGEIDVQRATAMDKLARTRLQALKIDANEELAELRAILEEKKAVEQRLATLQAADKAKPH